jgi:hypothetical protein
MAHTGLQPQVREEPQVREDLRSITSASTIAAMMLIRREAAGRERLPMAGTP